MKRIVALFLLYTLVGFASAQTCTPPTVTNRWLPTANGLMTDAVSGNNAMATVNQPQYISQTALNNHPGLAFDGATNYLALATPISAGASYSFYAVIIPNSTNGALVGNVTAGNDVSWWLNRYSGTPAINANGTQSVPSSVPNQIANNFPWIIAATYTPSTQAVSYTSCTLQGVCTPAGSGTLTGIPDTASPITTIGADAYFSYFSGTMLELGFTAGTLNTTALGTYAACQYGTTGSGIGMGTSTGGNGQGGMNASGAAALGNNFACTGITIYSDLTMTVLAQNCTPTLTGSAP